MKNSNSEHTNLSGPWSLVGLGDAIISGDGWAVTPLVKFSVGLTLPSVASCLKHVVDILQVEKHVSLANLFH